MKNKIKNIHFLLLSGYYNQQLDAINPEIKELILSTHSELKTQNRWVIELLKENKRVEKELEDSKRNFYELQERISVLQNDLISVYENFPFAVPNKKNKPTNLTIIHNHINIKDGDLVMNNLY